VTDAELIDASDHALLQATLKQASDERRNCYSQRTYLNCPLPAGRYSL